MVSWFENVTDTLHDVVGDIGAGVAGGMTAAPPVSGPAGHFSFDPDTLSGLVTDWTGLAKSYEKSKLDARALTAIDGPGSEYASQSHATVASDSGNAYLTSIDEKITYCYNQADKCQKALDDYMGVEHHTIGKMTQIDTQGGI
jgi:hypothetical protein